MMADGLTGLGSMLPGVSFIADDPRHGSNRTRSEEAVRAGQPMRLGRGQGDGPGMRGLPSTGDLQQAPMTDPDTPRHIQIRDGDHTIATAKVMTCEEAAGTARVWLHAAPGHVTPGTRASLVDAVMDLLDAGIPRPAGPEPASSVAAERSPADLIARPSPRPGPAVACGPACGSRRPGLSSADACRAGSRAGTWPQAGRRDRHGGARSQGRRGRVRRRRGD
jgi:hypothetical protein